MAIYLKSLSLSLSLSLEPNHMHTSKLVRHRMHGNRIVRQSGTHPGPWTWRMLRPLIDNIETLTAIDK